MNTQHLNLVCTVAPVVEPVTIGETKAAARIDGTEFDAILPGLIAAARQVAEQETGRRFISQTWRASLTDWPTSADVLPFYQPTAVAVTYWNGSTFATLATNAYVWANVGRGISLAPALTTSWPTATEVAIGPRVRVDVTLGQASAGNVDDCARTYIKALVAWWVANPEATAANTRQAAPFLASLLDPLRLY